MLGSCLYIYCLLTYSDSISFVTNMCKVDDLDESDFEDMENDHDIEENKNVTEVDTGDLDFEDDNVDDEMSDKEEESDTDHNIEENKNE